MGREEGTLVLCSLLVCLGLHIIFSKSDLCLSLSFTFLGLCWDTVHMLVSLPPDKLADFQQLALSLLQTLYVTVCRVMSFLGKAQFLYCWPFPFATLMLCHSEWHPRCLPFSYTIIFMCSFFSFLFPSTRTVGYITPKSSALQFPLPDVVIATDATPTYWAFYSQGSGLPYQLVVPGLVPCLGLILPCRNFQLLLSC